MFSWQKLRTTDLSFEKELQDNDLSRLTNLERSIRKRIEDILDPQPPKITHIKASTKAETNTHHLTSANRNGDTKKKGKKKNG